jgi:glycine cleavage system transcriptional repressor
MSHYYLLWASGEDQRGIVATLTKILFDHRCNLEDSAMMRLGSEFAVFLIFTSARALPSSSGSHIFSRVEKKFRLSVGLKKISPRLARFSPADNPFMVSVHGPDRPGIVYRVAETLAASRFNITDLSTHRTGGRRPGFILFIEGELKKGGNLPALRRRLNALARSLHTKISVTPLSAHPL